MATGDSRASRDGRRGVDAATPRRLLPQFQLRPQWWNWSAVYRQLDTRIAKQGTDELPGHTVHGLRFFWLDGIFASLSDNFVVSFVPLFVLTMGASNGQIGILTAIANLFGVAALLPGARAADATHSPRRLVLWSSGISRMMILGLVVLPFLGFGATAAIWAVIGINSVRSLLNNFANPAWTGIVADIVPEHRRGRYFSERNITMGIAALLVTSAGGVVIRRLGGSADQPLLGYQVVFLLAVGFGAASTIAFSRIPAPDHVSTGRRPKASGLLRALKGHPEFVGFLAGAFVWNLSIQIAAPFFNIYLVTELGGTPETVGFTAGVMSLFGLAGQLIFGRVLDRRGTIPVIAFSGLLIPLLPLGWGLATQVWHVFAIVAFGGIVWAGYNLANFNLLLELAPPESRNRAVALYQAVAFSAAVAGPVIGGVLIDIISYRPLFLATSFGRAAGTVTFLVLLARARRQANPEPPAGS